MKNTRINNKKTHISEIIFAIGIATMIVLTIFSVFLFRVKILESGIREASEAEIYDKHYVLIADDLSDPMWNSIYQGALQQGIKQNVYVEYFGENLPITYSVQQMLRIAIDAKVDGIIVAGDESKETVALIDEAVTKGIPVITVLNDSMSSLRQCFVGVNNYNLGQEYGRQALLLLRDKKQKIYVLMDSSSEDTSKNTTFLGIKDTIVEKYTDKEYIEIEAIAVDAKNSFISEETIRDLMLDEKNLPDILICLNAVDTRCAYQAAVDYNKVGKVEILGYYDSETILNAVEKNIIFSTIALDGIQMGSLCVDALSEYEQTGYVSGYFPVDTKLINTSNVNYYLDKIQEDKE